MRLSPGVLYTLGRIACFLVVAAVLFAIGFRSWLLVILSLFASAPLSYVLLRGVRTRWSAQLDERFTRRKEEKKRLRATLRGDEDKPA
jgi:hypothetical protein